MTRRVLVAGLGSQHRRDDAVGAVVAALAADVARAPVKVALLADPLDLLGQWDGANPALVVDAVRTGATPGTVHVVDLAPDRGCSEPRKEPADRPSGPIDSRATSTHGIGLAGVLRLARAVGRAPARVVVVGVEGEDFSRGAGLSSAVEAAVPLALSRVVQLIESEWRPTVAL